MILERIDMQFLELLIILAFSLQNLIHQKHAIQKYPALTYLESYNSLFVDHESRVPLKDRTRRCRIGEGRDHLLLKYMVCGEP
jgi:hypothetical protein